MSLWTKLRAVSETAEALEECGILIVEWKRKDHKS